MPRAGKAPLTPELHKQTLTFAGAVLGQLPLLSKKEQQLYIGNPALLARRLRDALVEKEEKAVVGMVEGNPDTRLMLSIYDELFGRTPDFLKLTIPRAPDARQYIAIPVMRELVEYTDGSPKEGLFQARKKLFPCWKYTNDPLDVAIPAGKDERHPVSGSYVVLMLDSETPDEDLMNKSANQIAEMGIKTSTDTEYALFSVAYFMKHGCHPDRKTWTLNSGSRGRGGVVPDGSWSDGGSDVRWCDPARCNPGLGSRRVVL